MIETAPPRQPRCHRGTAGIDLFLGPADLSIALDGRTVDPMARVDSELDRILAAANRAGKIISLLHRRGRWRWPSVACASSRS
jgi:2-keto-3-deoxy-L-rhamnonate aldolase RhmA